MRYATALPLTVGALMLMPLTVQANDQSEREAMLEEVAHLRDQVASIRASKDGHWLTDSRADEIRSLVNEVLADADTRASLMANGLGVGYDPDGGFFIRSADEQYSLNVRGVVQSRFMFNLQDDDAGGIDSTRWGFDNPYTRILGAGNVGNGFSYRVDGNFNDDGGEAWQLDSFIRWSNDDGYSVRFGQFRQPFMKESLVDGVNQSFITRSLVNEAFGYHRSQGLELDYTDGSGLRARIAFNDGEGRDNMPAFELDTEVAIAGRLEYTVGRGENANGNGNGNGNWEDPLEGNFFNNRYFDDEVGYRNSNIQVGLGGFFMKGESGTPADADEAYGLTVDGRVASGPASGSAAFVYYAWDFENPALDDRDQYGIVLEGGYFLTPEIQAIARYEYLDLDTADDEVNVFTIGANYFPGNTPNIRVTGDVSYAFDPIPSEVANQHLGYRADSADADSQVVIRTQLQLLF